MTKKWNWFTLLHFFVRFSSMFQKAQGSGKISLFIKVKTNPVTLHTCKTHTRYIKLKEAVLGRGGKTNNLPDRASYR